MIRRMTISLASLSLAFCTFAAAPSPGVMDHGSRPDVEKVEKQRPERPEKPETEKPEKSGLRASGGNGACPIYYNCPPPQPQPQKGGGGGRNPGEPQKPGVV